MKVFEIVVAVIIAFIIGLGLSALANKKEEDLW